MSTATPPPTEPSSNDDRHAWERPGAFEVAPGVYRIPLPLPGDALKAVNVYAIADGEQVVLVDGGWALAQSQELLGASLAGIGYDLRDVREFLVTHLHRDHYTQAVAVRRTYGNQVALGEGERVALEAIQQRRTPADIARLRLAGAPEIAEQIEKWQGPHAPDMADWEDPDRWLTDALELPLSTRTLTVIATPGHTIGHVVFHDPEHNALFAGDHVLPHITPSIGVEPVARSSPLRDYLSSLELIRKLPDAQLLPAHGPVTTSVHDRIDQLLTHHAERLDATAAAVDQGASTAAEVAAVLPWTRRKHRLADLDLFNTMLAINETMAHLIVLAERGWLTSTIVDGVQHFARA